jgi:light-harvesting complex I chlorophyll a/b binding protein 3
MAAMTTSSVTAVRAVQGARATFGSRAAFAAPTAKASKARFVCRAEGEAEAPAEEAPKAVVKKERKKDDLYMMGVSDQNMTYLDGTLPGDFGFDPLGMSDPEGAGGFVNPQWLAYSEVIHGRWAMLGVAGIVAPEILGGMGIIPESTGLVWFTSGAIPPQGTFDYWASPMTIFWVNMCLMNFAEIKRGQDYWFPGSQAETPLLGWEKGFGGSGNPAYPGGKWFNPLNLGKDGMASMQKKEVKNGRLAMMAFLGCMVQAAVTGEGPWKNICDHVSNPFGANMLANFGAIGGSSPF